MLPKYKQIEYPLLAELFRRGGSARPLDRDAAGRTIYDALAEYFALSREDQELVIPNAPTGTRKKWNNMVQYARRAQVDAANIDGSEKGVWTLTELGSEAAVQFLSEDGAEGYLAASKLKMSPEELQRALARDKETGLLGELHVLDFERERLRKLGRADLADRVEHVAVAVANAGFDIRSFDSDGRDRMIEVKSTRLPWPTRFFLSENERSVARHFGDFYWIYEVVGVGTASKVVGEIRDPESLIRDGALRALPTSWVVTHVAIDGDLPTE